MTGRVRSHRRPGPTWLLVIELTLAAIVLCGGYTAMRVALATTTAGHWLLGLLGAGGIGWMVARRMRRARQEREAAAAFARWRPESGWEPVAASGPWPWAQLLATPDAATVAWAYTKNVDGFEVTAGEISWTLDGLGRALPEPDADRTGRGVFVRVRLPRPVAGMAVRVHRQLYRLREGEDEFRRRFETIGCDSFRLDDPTFRAAHVSGEVPPWTAIDRDLFAFIPMRDPITPDQFIDSVRRTVRAAALLDLGPDRPGCAGPPTGPG